MIILDTHTWIWWIQGDARLSNAAIERLQKEETRGIAVSAISCWEIAKLVEHNKLQLPVPVEQWLILALSYPGIRLIPITPRIAVESTQLPGAFHKDPADQIIVATARVLDCPLMTADQKICHYPHVQLQMIT